MKLNKQAKLTLAHAAIWAFLMLLIAYTTSGSEYSQTLFIFMLGGWYLSHSLLGYSRGKASLSSCERRICSRLFDLRKSEK